MPEIEGGRSSFLHPSCSFGRPPFHERRLPSLSPSPLSPPPPPPTPTPLSAPIGRLMAAGGDGQRPVGVRTAAAKKEDGRTSRKKKWGEIRQHEIVFASDIQGRTGSAHTLDTHIEGATGTPRKIRGGRSPGRGWGPLATPVGLGHAELGRGPCRRGAFSAPRVQKADGRTDAGGRTADGRTDRVVVVFPL